MSGTDREAFWRRHVEAWRGSGLTLRAYAAAQGIGRWALGAVVAPGGGEGRGERSLS